MSRWKPFPKTMPADGDVCEVKLRSGTRYEAIWMTFGRVGGFALNMTRRRAVSGSSPVKHWRKLTKRKVELIPL